MLLFIFYINSFTFIFYSSTRTSRSSSAESNERLVIDENAKEAKRDKNEIGKKFIFTECLIFFLGFIFFISLNFLRIYVGTLKNKGKYLFK